MSSPEKPRREFRAWTHDEELSVASCDAILVATKADNPYGFRVPVRITIEDPADPKPDWPVGTRLQDGRLKATVNSEVFRHADGEWCFMKTMRSALPEIGSSSHPRPPSR